MDMVNLKEKIYSPMALRLIQLEDNLWVDQFKHPDWLEPNISILDKLYSFSIDNPLINIKISICGIHHIPYYIY